MPSHWSHRARVVTATILVSPTTPSLVPGFSLCDSEAQERETGQALDDSGSMAMNFQENVTMALAVLTILASIYFFNKAQQ
ncbi:small integral membrane protein 47 [Dasypus novemcinctus]|uniref:small integral membrane protein 47 n=1 Tax=Dasypus novemcinctus TaxID=9361 RepID=UPI00265F984A|nr:small integral membrane protein 47 [Dasypus novemcinctus]